VFSRPRRSDHKSRSDRHGRRSEFFKQDIPSTIRREEWTLAAADYQCDTHKLAKKMTVENSDDRDLG
jgi:hypothetical protein